MPFYLPLLGISHFCNYLEKKEDLEKSILALVNFTSYLPLSEDMDIFYILIVRIRIECVYKLYLLYSCVTALLFGEMENRCKSSICLFLGPPEKCLLLL